MKTSWDFLPTTSYIILNNASLRLSSENVFCSCAACRITALSWSANDQEKNNGYIAINGNRVLNTTTNAYAGFNLVELNVSSCSAISILHFDTQSSHIQALNMVNYINGLPLYTVLIGVTAGDAMACLTDTSMLKGIGIELSSLAGKVSFVAQIGHPGVSVNTLVGSNMEMTVDVTGICNKTNSHYKRLKKHTQGEKLVYSLFSSLR